MKIYKFSNILSLPFFLALLYFIVRLIKDTQDPLLFWAILPLAILILIYLFQPQLDYWWLSKRPVEIDAKIVDMISRTNSFYNTLGKEDKEEFDKRLLLYVNGRSFSAKGMEEDSEVPFDIKYMIAQIPVSLSFYNQDFLLKAYDRIIIYKHAFPSPIYRFLHTVEVNDEDGVIIFSLEHSEAALFKPEQFYNVAWHAYSLAYLSSRKNNFILEDSEANWKKLESISGFSRSFITSTLGFDSVEIKPTAVVCYFINADKFASIWPETYEAISEFLNNNH